MSERNGFDNFPVENLANIDNVLEGKDNRCTAKQRQWIHSMLEKVGMSEREALHAIGKEFLADEFTNPLREMTLNDASQMIDILKPLYYDNSSNNNNYGNRGYYNNRSHGSSNTTIGGWF